MRDSKNWTNFNDIVIKLRESNLVNFFYGVFPPRDIFSDHVPFYRKKLTMWFSHIFNNKWQNIQQQQKKNN